jgi:hypothetical protein
VNRSESLKEIAPALVKAQTKIKAALKDSTNPHFRSKYADLSSVVDAVKSPLLECGISFLQGVQDAEGGVAVETMLLHTSGEWISSTLRIPAVKQDAQGYGSAITYGRRYGLQAMCGVPAEDDDGNAATASTAAKGTITPNDGALDNLNESERMRAQTIAKRMIELDKANDLEAARVLIYENNLTNEMQLGIWHFLQPHSSLRNRVKKLNEAKRAEAAKAAEAAAQAAEVADTQGATA